MQNKYDFLKCLDFLIQICAYDIDEAVFSRKNFGSWYIAFFFKEKKLRTGYDTRDNIFFFEEEGKEKYEYLGSFPKIENLFSKIEEIKTTNRTVL